MRLWLEEVNGLRTAKDLPPGTIRPVRTEHDGRVFEASSQIGPNEWVYRTVMAQGAEQPVRVEFELNGEVVGWTILPESRVVDRQDMAYLGLPWRFSHTGSAGQLIYR